MACGSKKRKLALGGDPTQDPPFDINRFMQGIAHVESRGGKYMKNPHSSASGLYGQLYSKIPPTFLDEYDVSNRADFIGDTAVQNAYMRKVIAGNMKDTPRRTNLYKDALDLEKEYKPQLGDKFTFRRDELAALSHYLGRQGARKYLGGIRDNSPYHPPGVNKHPQEYLKLYNEGLPDMAKGGKIRIKPENKGKFTASAKRAGHSVQEHARAILNDPNATPLQKKRANFARNAAKWKKEYGGPIDFSTLDEATLQELGLGDWIRDNTQGVIGGLKTVAGIALTATGVGGPAGIGLIGSGIGDIASEIKNDRAADDQEKLLAEQAEAEKYNALKETKGAQMVAQANQTSNIGKDLVMREYGGFINYKGQSHKGPNGGIPVDKQGNPAAATGNKPVALTEEGEVAWVQPNGETYVFSKKLGYADQAQKIMNKYKIRLGKDFDGDDNLARQGMNKELTALYAEAKENEPEVSESGLPEGEDGIVLPGVDIYGDDPGAVGGFDYQMPYDTGTYDTLDMSELSAGLPPGQLTGAGVGEEYLPYNSAKGTMIGAGISGGLSLLGNILQAKYRKKPDKIKPVLTSPENVSLAEERIAARSRADLAKSEARTTARRMGASKAEDIATSNLAGATIDRNLGEQTARLTTTERQINAQLGQQARLSNQAARNRTRQLNAMRQDQFDQDTSQYYNAAIGAVQGATSDILRARQSADYLDVLAGRTGYQVMIDPQTGKKVLVPVEDYWNRYNQ